MADAENRTATWPGVTDRAALKESYVAASDRLADAARAGSWDVVLDHLGGVGAVGPNRWRLGGESLFAPLHQAAWHGAPVEVVARLVELGAWRSLRAADGRRPVDIARDRGHHHLLDLLATTDPSPRVLAVHAAWDEHLDTLVRERTRPLDPVDYRPVATEVVVAEALDSLWFPYPGMYGGFSVSTHLRRLVVESWCRVVGGSGQAHVITEQGCTLVDSGFI